MATPTSLTTRQQSHHHLQRDNFQKDQEPLAEKTLPTIPFIDSVATVAFWLNSVNAALSLVVSYRNYIPQQKGQMSSEASGSMLRMASSALYQDISSHSTGIGNRLYHHTMTVAMPPPLLDAMSQPENALNNRSVKRSLQLSLPSDESTDTAQTPNNNTTGDDEPFFDLYESPCLVKASNDAFSYQDYQDFGRMCNETFFGGCSYDDVADLQQDLDTESVVEWTIVFDYEVYYTGDPIPAVDHVETIILEHLSEITQLNRCLEEENDNNEAGGGGTTVTTVASLSSGRVGILGREGIAPEKEVASDNGYRRRTTEYIHDFTDEEFSRMVAISSDPGDVLDPDYNNCIVPVPSSISSNADCLPVAGAIHLYLNTNGDDGFLDVPNTRLSIQSGFQRLIRFGMQEGLYISGDVVKHVSFIGTRIYVGDESPPINILEGDVASNGDSRDMQRADNRAGIIIGVVGTFVFVVLAWVLLAVRRKRNAIVSANEDLPPLQGGDETALSSIPAGVADEENPYLVVKAPLSVTQFDPETPHLSSMVTAGTMASDLEEEEGNSYDPQDTYSKDTHDKKLQGGQTIVGGHDDETGTTGDIKIFHDDEEEEDERMPSDSEQISNSHATNNDRAEKVEDGLGKAPDAPLMGNASIPLESSEMTASDPDKNEK